MRLEEYLKNCSLILLGILFLCTGKAIGGRDKIISTFNLSSHSSLGKDRTGLIIALIHLLLLIPDSIIAQEYAQSENELQGMSAEIDEELQKIGLPVSFKYARAEMMLDLIEWIREQYGGVSGYLSSVGVSTRKQDELVETILNLENI